MTADLKKEIRFLSLPGKMAVTIGLCLILGILIVREFRSLQPLLTRNFVVQHILMEREKVKSKARAVTLNHMMPSFGPLADALGGGGQVSEAQYSLYAQYYAKVIEYMPDRADAYGLLGYCYYHLGQANESRDAFQKAALLSPRFFWFPYDAGIMYFRSGEYRKAAEHLQRALAARPEQVAAFFRTSKLYQDILRSAQGNPLVTPERLREGYRDCYRMLAMSYQKLNMYPQMLATSLNALKAGVGGEDAFYYYGGLASFQMKDYAQAIALLKESVQHSSDNPEAYRYLGLSLRAAGNEQTATQALQTAERLSRQTPASPDERTAEPRIF